jgi:hypothetical protein
MRPEFAALDASIEGELIHPESPEYESVRRPAWAQYGNVRPEAVVRCRTPTDVAESLAVARRLDLEVAPRGGGQCFAGRSATGGLVIDLSAIRSVGESDGIATVGAGARLGEIDDRLATDALAIPAQAACSQLRRPRTDRLCDRVLRLQSHPAWSVSRRYTTPTTSSAHRHTRRNSGS